MKFFLCILFLAFVSLISCSDDNSTTPSVETELLGNWKGEYISGNDSLIYSAVFTNGDNVYKANMQLDVIKYIIQGNMTQRTAYRKSGTAEYTYKKPEIKIKLLSESSFYFEGEISANNTQMVGKVELTDDNGVKSEVDIVLYKAIP